MDAERIQQLDSIGLVWDAQGANWNTMFEQLWVPNNAWRL
jgi:hypothetical protein